MREVLRAPKALSPPSTPAEGSAVGHRYRNLVWMMVCLGNIVGTLQGVLSTAFGVGTDPDRTHAVHNAEMGLLVAGATILVFIVSTVYFARAAFRPIGAWLERTGGPTDVEHRALDSLPGRSVLWSVTWWVIALATNIPIEIFWVGQRVRGLYLFQGIVSLVAGAATSAILTYLLMERTLRPLTGLAARSSGTPRPSQLGALPRLLMAFAAGVAGPLITLGIGLIGLNARQRAALVPIVWVTVFVVLFGGFLVAVVAARAVVDPIDEIRSRFARLQAGDLDAEVAVTEPGEIGELQVGFNEMVKALREQEQMRDVFVRLVGRDVAQHALESGSGLGGEVREATAMFVDIIGSTPLAESNSPHDYLGFLNAFFDVVVHSVEAAGGAVNQFQGDGALCIFGAPVEQPDHAARALRAARELRTRLDCFAQSSGIEAVIGLSTGDVVAGHVGTADRYEFTVVGDAVNEAKRLAEQAKTAPTKVLVSAATIHSAEGEVANWHEATSVYLRGRSQPTTAFAPNSSPPEDAHEVR